MICGLLTFALLRSDFLSDDRGKGTRTGAAGSGVAAALDGLFPLNSAEQRPSTTVAHTESSPPGVTLKLPDSSHNGPLAAPDTKDADQAKQRSAEDSRREADLQARQLALDQAAAAQEQHARELAAQQASLVAAANEVREKEAERAKREEAAALEAARKPKPYSGPTSGAIVWEGTVSGDDLITISGGTSDVGTVVSGALPGVTVLISPTDTKHVRIASAPAPSNGFKRVVIGTSGKGAMKITLHWSLP